MEAKKKAYSVRLRDEVVCFLKKHGGITKAIERMAARCIRIEKECDLFNLEINESDFF